MSMAFEEREWLKRACSVMGPLPENYIVIDAETSGLNHEKDVALQVASLVCTGPDSVFDSFVIDWITGQSQPWIQQLTERIEKTRATIVGSGGVYDFTAERLQRDGISPQAAAVRLSQLGSSLPGDYCLVAHNGLAVDLPFTTRICRSNGCDTLEDNREYIDTMSIERGVQLRPKLSDGMTWSRFSSEFRYSGGSKVKCNLRDHCTNKYGLPPKDDHEADRDVVKTAFLLRVYREASR